MPDPIFDVAFRYNFEKDLREEIARCKTVSLPAGTVLNATASIVRNIPLVISGSIKVARADSTGKEILMYHIKSGESCIISITSSLKNNFAPVDDLLIVTDEPTTMLLVSDHQVRIWHDTYKSWRHFVTDLYNLRIIDILSLVDAVAFQKVDQRLIMLLDSKQNAENEINSTHQEIADRLGTAREVVSRLLKQLEKAGKIELGRAKIRILKNLL